MIIARQQTEYVFYWADGNGPDPSLFKKSFERAELGFGSNQQAAMFLRRYPELFLFRQLLNQRYPGQTRNWRLEDVYSKLAAEIVRKRLKVLKRWIPAEGPSRDEGAATKVPRKEQVAEPKPGEPPTFLSNHNSEAQAENLAAAASSGEPFCEECVKALLQAQAATAAGEKEEKEPESFPPSHDGDNQAAALISAAQDGVPFCEECEKAKQEAKAAGGGGGATKGAGPATAATTSSTPAPAGSSAKSKDDEPPKPEAKNDLTWIEIYLADAESKGISGIPYQLIDVSQQKHEGVLDGRGRARVEGIPPGACQVTFPTLDQESWDHA